MDEIMGLTEQYSVISGRVLEALERDHVSAMSIGMAVKVLLKMTRDRVFEMPSNKIDEWMDSNINMFDAVAIKSVTEALSSIEGLSNMNLNRLS